MMGDPNGEVTRALGIELDHPGPRGKLGPGRCKRVAYHLVDGVVKVKNIAEGPDDPAGDDNPEVTLAPAMIEEIKKAGNFKAEL